MPAWGKSLGQTMAIDTLGYVKSLKAAGVPVANVVELRLVFIVRDDSVLHYQRFTSASRQYFARSFGAITHEKIGAKTKLNPMTIGRRTGACSDKLGIESTIVAPIPNRTALTIMLNNSDIENLVDIGRRPPCHSLAG